MITYLPVLTLFISSQSRTSLISLSRIFPSFFMCIENIGPWLFGQYSKVTYNNNQLINTPIGIKGKVNFISIISNFVLLRLAFFLTLLWAGWVLLFFDKCSIKPNWRNSYIFYQIFLKRNHSNHIFKEVCIGICWVTRITIPALVFRGRYLRPQLLITYGNSKCVEIKTYFLNPYK